MKSIDYVVISSDDNSDYKDFYPIIAKRWHDIGIKTYYINITNEDSIVNNEYGVIHKIKSLENIDSGFQSQVVRLFSSNFIDGNILISDIDMLPINKEYFYSYLSELTLDNIILYSGQPYGDVPFYPMCYVLSNSNTLKNILEIKDINFLEFCNKLINDYDGKWNTDENFMYDKLNKNIKKLIIKNRNFSNRIDRSNWYYDEKLLSNFYIDSHLLKPYSKYYEKINDLINKLK